MAATPTRYLDADGNFLHKEDVVSFPNRADLAGQRGVIDSFYLKRDGRYRAKVYLQGHGSRALGVLTAELRKAVSEGPEPVYEPLEQHAAALRAALSPGGTHHSLAPHIAACVSRLALGLDAVARAMRTWPPPLECRADEPLSSLAGALHEEVRRLVASRPAEPMLRLVERLAAAAEHTIGALGCFAMLYADDVGVERPAHLRELDASRRIQEVMISQPRCLDATRRARRRRADALQSLHSLRSLLDGLFVEPLPADDLRVLDAPSPAAAARVGLHRPQKASAHAREERRGGFLLYVPDAWDGATALPLVVALHGVGPEATGPAFLWELRREACTRGFALLSPSSLGYTWGAPPPMLTLPAPGATNADADTENVLSLFREVCVHWPVDPTRVLLLGFCDGANFSLSLYLRDDLSHPFTAAAILSPSQEPHFVQPDRVRRVYLLHGTKDIVLPIQRVRQGVARAKDRHVGLALDFRQVEDLSHALPDAAELHRILLWWHPSFALVGEEIPTPAQPTPGPPPSAADPSISGGGD
ncbi:hypothetical protein AB1Y20_009419 [Prymnesium parvum]|uniref:Phospholipase/carboxylesterase/thioesterase domain-containing protein n=1 Tax=Prymnesium parvum TaxID=97485 RepID=A0AB34K4A4_PRYPA